MTTKYRLQQQPDQAWASITEAGIENAKVLKLDGSGLSRRNRIMHIELIQASPDIALQTRMRLSLSQVTVSDRRSQGLAVRHRGFKLTGSEPDTKIDTQVWDSKPEEQGARAWIQGNHSDFRTYSFINKLPGDTTHIDYVTFELVMNATGHALIDDVSCKHFYNTIENFDVAGATRFRTATLFPTFYNDLSGILTERFGATLTRKNFTVLAGKRFTMSVEGGIAAEARQVVNGSNIPCPCDFGLSLLMTKVGGQVEFFDIANGYSDSAPGFRLSRVSESRPIRARSEYQSFRLLFFVRPLSDRNATDVYASGGYCRDLLIDLIEDDFIAPSQG